MSEVAMHVYADAATLDASLSAAIAQRLREAISERGRATIAVSGGSTPRGLLTRLGQQSLAWEAVTVTLVDERWVDENHNDSNARMVRETLLRGAADQAHFEPLYVEMPHPAVAVESLEDRLASLGTLDCVMLGMGGDGHFASLFPKSDALLPGLDLAGKHSFIAVDPPSAPHPRMSMTLPRIIDTRRLLLHITGDAKRSALERAAADRNSESLPIAAILDLSAPLPEIHWAP